MHIVDEALEQLISEGGLWKGQRSFGRQIVNVLFLKALRERSNEFWQGAIRENGWERRCGAQQWSTGRGRVNRGIGRCCWTLDGLSALADCGVDATSLILVEKVWHMLTLVQLYGGVRRRRRNGWQAIWGLRKSPKKRAILVGRAIRETN